jgi:microcystin-dependent protein
VRGDAVELIANNTVGTAQLGEGAVTASKLTSNAITLVKIAAGQITESKLADNAVSTRTIAASAVTNAKIADVAIGSSEILDRAVGTSEIQSGAVESSELASLAITTAKLVDNSVLRTHLAPLSITSVKLGPNSITEPAVASAAVLPQHVHNEVLPVGMLLAWAGANAPSPEWLIANGAAVSRTTYAALFAYLGTSFGAGNGSTTFNLPDMRGRTPVGVNTSNGYTASLANDGIAQNVRGPKHGHGIGSVGITTDGDHIHFYAGPGDPAYNSVAAGEGPDHAYGSNIVAATTGGGAHSHVISSWAGHLDDPNYPPGGNGDALFHQVINYLIKVL